MVIVALKAIRDGLTPQKAADNSNFSNVALELVYNIFSGAELTCYNTSPRTAFPTKFSKPLWSKWIEKCEAHYKIFWLDD